MTWVTNDLDDDYGGERQNYVQKGTKVSTRRRRHVQSGLRRTEERGREGPGRNRRRQDYDWPNRIAKYKKNNKNEEAYR